jgi:precorrin-4/cobalt-precorrin-4 C11-methyltransferase
MSANTLYFIGAGPGAPDLITLKGANALKKSKYVFLVDSYRYSFAGLIKDKELYSPFDYLFCEITKLVAGLLEKGDVSFLVPGDFTIFSPFQSIVSYFYDRCGLIPGVSSLNAASSLLKKTLDLPKISGSIIITSPRSISKTDFTRELSELIRKDSTLVLLMNNMPATKLRQELLKEYPPNTPVAVTYKVSMPDEEVVLTTVDELPNDIDDDKFFNIGRIEPCPSIVIVGDVIAAAGDPKFWDYRKINIWDKHKRRD